MVRRLNALLKSETILLRYYHIVSITPTHINFGIDHCYNNEGKRFYPKKGPWPRTYIHYTLALSTHCEQHPDTEVHF